MPVVVFVEVCTLALAGGAVVAGAFGLRMGRVLRGIIFGVAASSGLALLTALAPTEWVLGLTLVPLTALSAAYFARTVRERFGGWEGWVAVAALLFVGAALLLSRTPRPLTRAVIVGSDQPVETITPGAGRPVRG